MVDTRNNTPEAPSPWTKEQLTKLKLQIIKGETPLTAPNSGRFQKGKSGNPKGRPRKELKLPPPPGPGSLHQVTLEESRQLLCVRGSEQKIPAKQAVLKAQLAAAITGNAHAQRHLLERIERAEAIEAVELANEIFSWREYVATQNARIAEAKSKGEPEPWILPHPVDVVIERGKPIRFIGPFDEIEHKLMLERIRYREQLILQAALDERCWPLPRTNDPLDGPGTARLLAESMNASLPPRLRWTDNDRLRIELRLQRLTKRELLKRTFRGWQSIRLGIARRGRLTKPMRWATELVSQVHTTIAVEIKATADGGLQRRDEIAEEFYAVASMGSIWMPESRLKGDMDSAPPVRP